MNIIKIYFLIVCIIYSFTFGCAKQAGPTGPVITPDTPVVVSTATLTMVAGTTTYTPTVTLTFATWVPTSTQTPVMPTNTRTRTSTLTPQPSASHTATVTATPAAAATVYITGYLQGWNNLTNVVCSVTIQDSSDYSYLAATSVNLINLTHPQTINIPYDGANNRNYYINYSSSDEYRPGDTYRLELVYGGNTYSAEITAPGSFTIGPYSPVNGIPFLWLYGGNTVSFRLWDVSLGLETSEPYPAWNMPPTVISSGFEMPASKFITGNDYTTFVSIAQSGDFSGAQAGSSFSMGTEEYQNFDRIGLPTYTATVSNTPSETQTNLPSETTTPTLTDTPTEGDTWTHTNTASPTPMDTAQETYSDTPTITWTETIYIAPTNTATIALNIALDAPGLTITDGGDNGPFVRWTAKTYAFRCGTSKAENSMSTPGKKVWMETTVEGPSDLEFYWFKSELVDDPGDALYLMLDGVDMDVLNVVHGYYLKYTYHIPAGAHVFRWEQRQTSTDIAFFSIDCVSAITATVTPTITNTRTATPTNTPYFSATSTATPSSTATSTQTPSWKSAGTCITGGSADYNCTASDGSDIYVGYQASSNLYARKYNGATWNQIGASIGTGIPGDRWIAAKNGTVWAVYKRNDNSKISFNRYDSGTDTWTELWTSAASGNAPSIWIEPVSGNIYFAYQDAAALNPVIVMEYNLSVFTQLGAGFGESYVSGNQYPICISGYNKAGTINIYATYADSTNGMRAHMWRWNGSVWSDSGLVYPSTNGQNTIYFAVDTDPATGDMYVSFQDWGWRHETMVYKYLQASYYFTPVGSNGTVTAGSTLASYDKNTDIKVLDSTHVYVAYNDYSNNYSYVSVFGGASWSLPPGFAGLTGVASYYISLELVSGSPYLSYNGNTGCVTDISVKKYQ